jgi:hypothetical protein
MATEVLPYTSKDVSRQIVEALRTLLHKHPVDAAFVDLRKTRTGKLTGEVDVSLVIFDHDENTGALTVYVEDALNAQFSDLEFNLHVAVHQGRQDPLTKVPGAQLAYAR